MPPSISESSAAKLELGMAWSGWLRDIAKWRIFTRNCRLALGKYARAIFHFMFHFEFNVIIVIWACHQSYFMLALNMNGVMDISLVMFHFDPNFD